MLLRRAAAGYAARRVAQLKPARGLGHRRRRRSRRCCCSSRGTSRSTTRRACWPGGSRTTRGSPRPSPGSARSLPAPSGAWDRDPVALLLAALATLLALALRGAGRGGRARARARGRDRARGARARRAAERRASSRWAWRASGPTARTAASCSCRSRSTASWRAQSPYGADYSGTILGAPGARVELLGRARRQPDPPPPRLPAGHAPRDAAVPPRVAGGASASSTRAVVTLLFYALVGRCSRARLPAGGDARLAAAGVAALNPLVYWHQIFGANDLVFVAMLLAAVLLARAERQRRGGGAPRPGVRDEAARLAVRAVPARGARRRPLVPRAGRAGHLAAPRGSARRGRGGLPARRAARRGSSTCARSGPTSSSTTPGLRGGDNYPLGRHARLRLRQLPDLLRPRRATCGDYFPFSVFYPLLVPLGLLLVRAQMRDGRPEWALATGSAALLASLYFSRVVHPNYLIAAAVVPAARGARRAARRRPGARAAAAARGRGGGGGVRRLPHDLGAGGRRLLGARVGTRRGARPEGGTGAHAATRSGSSWAPTAAGLGVLYLSLAAAGADAPRAASRWRPSRSRSWSSRRRCCSRAVSTQHGHRARAGPGAWCRRGRRGAARWRAAAPTRRPPRPRRAGARPSPSSFRLDPPAELLPEAPLAAAGPRVAGRRARALVGVRDPRLGRGPGARGARRDPRRTLRRAAATERRIAVALLSAPLALGTVLGAPLATSLAAVVGAWACCRAGHDRVAGVLAGLAVALDHRALLVGPVRAPGRGPRPDRCARRSLRPRTYLALVLPVALLDPPAFVERACRRRPGGSGPRSRQPARLPGRRGPGDVARARSPPSWRWPRSVWLLRRPWSALARGALASLVGDRAGARRVAGCRRRSHPAADAGRGRATGARN